MPITQKNNTKKLRILPLGGIKEIGMNMLVVEYDNEVIIIDAGFMFPKDNMFGVDYVLPDMAYLEKKKVEALLLTHGHEDHIGAIPFLLRKFPHLTIYGTKLTLAFVLGKINDYPKEFKNVKTREVTPRSKKRFGKYFAAEFINVNHSILDAVGLAITTPVGTIIHTGDFKIDLNPMHDDFIDLHKFAEYGDKNVLLLMSDSTNVERDGFSITESDVFKRTNNVFAQTDGMIVVATFASSIERIQDLIDAAVSNGRLVALSGRSLLKYVQISREMGYINVSDDVFVPIEKINKYPREKLVCITTGTQGEPYSSLALIASNSHRNIKVGDGDTVIFSSSVIPGNEMSVNRMVNELIGLGVKLVNTQKEILHVSGHAASYDLMLMARLVKPKFFMPLHGEKRHLIRHIELIENLTRMDTKGFLVYNGNALEISKNHKAEVVKAVDLRYIYVDGKGVGDIEDTILDDRLELASNGVVFVMATVNISNTFNYDIEVNIDSKGFIYRGGANNNSGNKASNAVSSSTLDGNVLIDNAIRSTKETIKRVLDKNKRTPSLMRYEIRENLRRLFIKNIAREPVIFVSLNMINRDKNIESIEDQDKQCQSENKSPRTRKLSQSIQRPKKKKGLSEQE